MKITDHCFVTSAPVFVMDVDDRTDPFFDDPEVTAYRDAMSRPPGVAKAPSPFLGAPVEILNA